MSKRKRPGVPLLSVLFGLLLLAAPLAPLAAQDDLRVMSFNIRYGNAADGADRWELRRGLVFDVLRDEQPDVVGLQEALRFQIDEIREAVPGYAEVGEGRDGGEDGEYSAILYREERFDVLASDTFWLSETPDVPSAHWGNRYVRICTWGHFREKTSPDRAFYVFNTHLDHESQASRERSAELLAERIAGRAAPDPYVLTGDFNAGEDNAAIRFLGDQAGLVDTFRAVHPDQRRVGTFNGFKGRADGEKIDAVLVPPGVDVVDAAILRKNLDGRYPSDHFPVTARVRFDFRVLVFSKTAGYRHASIPDGVEALRGLGRRAGFLVEASEDAAIFQEDLSRFRVIVFLCTTGDILGEDAQNALQRYVRAGGGFLGVHAASDTEYEWPWYGRLVGAYFAHHPEIQTARVVLVEPGDPAVRGLPSLWERRDEWYNFKAVPEAVEVLAVVDEESYHGGRHGRHPIAWYHAFDGGRAFYTAMGHTRESYRDPLFRRHLLGGVLYAAGRR
jgi:endonuclease/exonuclease/phosphatase family metal-dependent hydrolase/type 1 glutamine amidotransferase